MEIFIKQNKHITPKMSVKTEEIVLAAVVGVALVYYIFFCCYYGIKKQKDKYAATINSDAKQNEKKKA